MGAKPKPKLKMKCRLCDVLIDQEEADRAAHIVGPAYETVCTVCAQSLANDAAVPARPERMRR